MSFWTGVANATKDIDAKNEREAMRDERDADRDTAAAATAKADARWEKQWANTISEQKKTRAAATAAAEVDQTRYDAGELRLDKAEEVDAAAVKAADLLAAQNFNFQTAAVDYTKSRDIVSDLRNGVADAAAAALIVYTAERDKVGEDQAKLNYEQKLAEYENTVKQQGVTNGQWDEAHKFSVKKFDTESALEAEKFVYDKTRHGIEDIAAQLIEQRAESRFQFDKEQAEFGNDIATANQTQRDLEYRDSMIQQGVTNEQFDKSLAQQKAEFKVVSEHKSTVFEYDQTQDAAAALVATLAVDVAANEALYQKERDTKGDVIAAANRAHRDKVFENTVKNQGVTTEQWTQSFNLQQSQAKFGNEFKTEQFTYNKSKDNLETIAAAVEVERVKAQTIYDRERDVVGDEIAKSNRDLRMEIFENTVKQQGVSNEQWTKAFGFKESQAADAQANIALNREIEMLKLDPLVTTAFSGRGSGSTKGSKAPSAEVMEKSIMNLKSALGGPDGLSALSATNKEFWDTVLDNPAAAHGIYGFHQTQVLAGNNIKIEDLPNHIRLAGMSEGSGVEAYDQFKEDFANGEVDMADSEQYLKGLKALMNYKPAEVVWGVVKSGTKVGDDTKEFGVFQQNLLSTASLKLGRMQEGDEGYAELQSAMRDLRKTGPDNAAVRQRGMDKLFPMFGKELATDLGMEGNRLLQPYLNMYDADEKAEEARVLDAETLARRELAEKRAREDAEALANGTGPELVVSETIVEEETGPVEPPYFASDEEATEFLKKNPDFVGQMVVEGRGLISNESTGPVVQADDLEGTSSPIDGMGEEELLLYLDTDLTEAEEAEAWAAYDKLTSARIGSGPTSESDWQ